MAALTPALAALCAVFTFMPIGLGYLGLILLSLALLLQRHQWPQRLAQLRPWLWLLTLPLLWALLVLALQGWHEDSGTRLFHLVRVSWLLALGLLLLAHERWWVLYGFMAGALYASAVFGWLQAGLSLPDIGLWGAYISVTGNASSQKMIMLAAAAAVALGLTLGIAYPTRQRLLWLAAAALFASTVALHSVSRNAHLLLLLLPAVLLLYHWRRWYVLPLGAALALALALLLWWLSPTFEARFVQAWADVLGFWHGAEIGASVGIRLQMALVALQGFWQQPLLGTGLGSWTLYWQQAAPSPELAGINNPHNDFLLTAMETGAPGLLLLLALLLRLGWQSWQRADALACSAHLLLWTLALTALVNAPLRDAVLGLSMVWLLAAWTLGSGACGQTPGARTRTRLSGRAATP